MNELRKRIEELVVKYESYVEKTEEQKGEEFNPMDASGGNFDDAYYMGCEHGEESGKLEAYQNVLKLIDESEAD